MPARVLLRPAGHRLQSRLTAACGLTELLGTSPAAISAPCATGDTSAHDRPRQRGAGQLATMCLLRNDPLV